MGYAVWSGMNVNPAEFVDEAMRGEYFVVNKYHVDIW